MDKQELIDTIINILKGCDMPLSGLKLNHRDFSTYQGYLVEWVGGKPVALCRHSFLPKRAKELGWINGYKWGVEYPTNGKKPDLPDGTVVEWYSWTDDGPEWHLPMEIQYLNNWSNIDEFRIVDERYKPKESKLETDNSWHQRGEFPPADTVCEVLHEGQWYETKIVGMDGKYCVYVSEWLELPYDGNNGARNFRPIKTEREREKAEKAILIKQKFTDFVSQLNELSTDALLAFRETKEAETLLKILADYENKK